MRSPSCVYSIAIALVALSLGARIPAAAASPPPHFLVVHPVAEDTLRLVFDRALDPLSVTDLGHYVLSFGVPIVAEPEGGNPSAVRLAIASGPGHGTAQSVTVNGLQAMDGTLMAGPEVRVCVSGVLRPFEVQDPDPAWLAAFPPVDRSRFAGPDTLPGPSLAVAGVVVARYGDVFGVVDPADPFRNGVFVECPSCPWVVGDRYVIAGRARESSGQTLIGSLVFGADQGLAPPVPPVVVTARVLRDTTCDVSQALLTLDDFDGMYIEVDSAMVLTNGPLGAPFIMVQPYLVGESDTLLVDNDPGSGYAPLLGDIVKLRGGTAAPKGKKGTKVNEIEKVPEDPGEHDIPGLSQEPGTTVCGVTAAGSCLAWFEQNGNPPAGTTTPSEPEDIRSKLKDKELGDGSTIGEDEAEISDLAEAMNKYIKSLTDTNLVAKPYIGGQACSNFDFIKSEFAHGEDILLLVKYKDEKGVEHGHYVTVRFVKEENGELTVIYMDPAQGAYGGRAIAHFKKVTENGKTRLEAKDYGEDGNKTASIAGIVTCSPVPHTESTVQGQQVTYTLHAPGHALPKDFHVIVSDPNPANYTVQVPPGYTWSLQTYTDANGKQITLLCVYPINPATTAPMPDASQVKVTYTGTQPVAEREKVSMQTTTGAQVPAAGTWAPQPGKVHAVVELPQPGPAAPDGLKTRVLASAQGTLRVMLSWDPSTDPATAGYDVYDQYSGTLLAHTPGTSTILNLPVDWPRRLEVRATGIEGAPGARRGEVGVFRDALFSWPYAAGGAQTLLIRERSRAWHRPWNWRLEIPGSALAGTIAMTTVDGDPSPPFPTSPSGGPVIRVGPWYAFAASSGLQPGSVRLTLGYPNGRVVGRESTLRLLGLVGNAWVDVTTSVDSLADSISCVMPGLTAVALVRSSATTAAPNGDEPRVERLLAPAPNPFQAATVVHYSLPQRERAIIEVFDARGRRIATPVDTWMPAGTHSLVWKGVDDRGRSVAPGLYFVRLRAGGRSQELKMVQLR